MGKKKKQEEEEEEVEEEEEPGCCADTHAKCFEIVLILGFVLSFIVLIVNLILTLDFFKSSILLLILEIIPIAFNFISIILSVILRLWRSDESVFKKNFSSSNCVSCLLLVIIIINLLLSIVEEVLYYFVYTIINLEAGQDEDINKLISNILEIIMKTSTGDDGVTNPSDSKLKIFNLLPWVAFSLNNFVQFISIILDCILKGRIDLKSHLGFPRRDKNKSTKNKLIDSSKKKKKKKKKDADIFFSNGTDVTNLKKKKTKKKKKKNSSKKKKHY
jgi:hypothetical protein